MGSTKNCLYGEDGTEDHCLMQQPINRCGFSERSASLQRQKSEALIQKCQANAFNIAGKPTFAELTGQKALFAKLPNTTFCKHRRGIP